MSDQSTQPTTTQQDTVAANQEESVRILLNAKEKSTYRSEWKRYKKWLASKQIGPDESGRFITRDNLNLYFTGHIAKERSGNRDTVQRAANSIQWYADHREHVLQKFVVKDSTWESSLNACLTRQKTSIRVSPKGKVTDPHKGLKDVTPEESRIVVMDFIYRNRRDWGSAAVAYTWGNNAAVRGDSSRKMVYSDLNLSKGFGLAGAAFKFPALLLVLRKGDVHKDRKDTDQQVACWRHREFKLCSVLATALHVVYTLANDNTVNFYHINKSARAIWWDKPLIN